MEEKTYLDYLDTYRKGVNFILTYSSKRRNREISREIGVDEISEDDKKPEPVFRFKDSGDIVCPQQIGGFEKMVISVID